MKHLSKLILESISLGLMVLFLFSIGCQQSDASKEFKLIVDAYIDTWNTGNLNTLDAIIDQQFIRHVSPASTTGAVDLDSLKKVISNFRTTYPDFQVTLDEEIYTDNKGAGRWRYTGTNTGPGSIPPTGKKISATGISILHFKDGKIMEEWVESDNLTVMMQLGFTLTPPSVATGM
jgi:predicted ester cyclase